MTWQPEMDELRRRQEMAKRMGGADKVKRQHDGGRLTVRERVDRLVDQGSFREIGSIAGKAEYDGKNDLVDLMPANAVMGRGKIDGRHVAVTGDDFTVRGGSADATIKEKDIFIERYANQYRVPLIRMIEGSGGGGSVKTIETTGRANVPGVKGWEWVVQNMGVVPTVGLGLGSVAGLGAARLAATHYSVMVKEISAMFVAGPPVVNRLSPKQYDKQERGGWEIQLRAGAIDEALDSEDEAFAATRRFLSYLPSSVYEAPPRGPVTDDPGRREEELFEVIPRDIRKVYRIRPIIEKIVDKGSFFEMGRLYGRSVVTGFARIDGWPVAVMASDPMFYGGGWTADACQKVARFVDMAETFHLPAVYFCDCPGFLIGLEAEKSLRILAREGLGYALEAHAIEAADVPARKAGLEAALDAFAAIQPEDDGLYRDYALYHQARVLAVLDRRDEAVARYHEVLDKLPQSPLTQEINNRLAVLAP
jgi:acetyl-CoA carboxylase carboxyltransferase component